MVSWKGEGDYYDDPNERLLNHPSAIENTSTRSGITLEQSQHPEKSELTADDGTDQTLEWMDEEEQIDGGGEGDRTPDPLLAKQVAEKTRPMPVLRHELGWETALNPYQAGSRNLNPQVLACLIIHCLPSSQLPQLD